MTAQRLADEISDNAHRQAATITKDAESRATLILERAQARYEDVQREIDGLRLKRREVEHSVEAVIASLKNTIDFVREQDARDREEKILLHRPRQTDSQDAAGWSQDRKAEAQAAKKRLG
jgi:vacuolar-type H+-ATPase subunit E/Vma4